MSDDRRSHADRVRAEFFQAYMLGSKNLPQDMTEDLVNRIMELIRSNQSSLNNDKYYNTGPRAFALLNEVLSMRSPVNMVLHCPCCHLQHVDAPGPGKDWDNPPHRSHRCALCGCVWRPADVPTNGVRDVATRGKDDNWRSAPWRPSE